MASTCDVGLRVIDHMYSYLEGHSGAQISANTVSFTAPSRYRQACRGYEICHPYPYPQIFRAYPWIYPWIGYGLAIFISTDAYCAYI